MSIKVIGADVEFMKFSAGEPHVKVTNFGKNATIRWNFKNFEEFMYIAMIVDVLKNSGTFVCLDIPYLPFGRQDRATSKEQPFSLKIFCNMLKTLSVDHINLYDPHSEVSYKELVKEGTRISVYNQLCCALSTSLQHFLRKKTTIYDCVISPDKGAVSKSGMFANTINKPLICATKVRDPLTGQLSSPTIDFGDLKPKRALIPDDLIDGGFTFIQLADEIKRQFPDVVLDLYATHGIFSRGKEELNKRFNKIYVYNDMSKEKTQ